MYLTFMVMLFGDPISGKEDFVKRYMSGYFIEDLKLTIGVDFYTKTTFYKGKKYIIQLFDFSEKHLILKNLVLQYAKGSNGAIIMYDLANLATLDRIPELVQLIRKERGDMPIFLIGNKSDLGESHKISKDEGFEISKKYNLSGYIEISTKTGQNIEKAFEMITEVIINSIKKKIMLISLWH